MRLRFTVRFLGGVEGAVEDRCAALSVRLITIRSKRSECCADLFDVIRGGWMAFEIPSSKLGAHDLLPSSFGVTVRSTGARLNPSSCSNTIGTYINHGCWPREEARSVNADFRVGPRYTIPRARRSLSQPSRQSVRFNMTIGSSSPRRAFCKAA